MKSSSGSSGKYSRSGETSLIVSTGVGVNRRESFGCTVDGASSVEAKSPFNFFGYVKHTSLCILVFWKGDVKD
jgi:hypothetical protein